MQHARSFTWAVKDGREGWLPDGAPNFDPGVPVHVAHDTLEHFNGSESFKNELLAFGSIIFGRAYMDTTGQMIEVASNDLSGFLVNQKLEVEKAVTRWDRKLDDPYAESLVGHLAQLTYMKLIMHYGVPPQLAARTVEKCLPWVRLGYRLADRRWKGDHHMLDSLFERVFHRVIHDHDAHFPHVGDHLTVKIDTSKHSPIQLHREPA